MKDTAKHEREKTQGGDRSAGGGAAKSGRTEPTTDPGKTPGQAEREDPDPSRTLRSRDSRLRG
jgi:hypothetical protein